MLTRLELTNFKKHKHLELEFTEGLTVLTGPNYSGKSSILHAILYALGGPRAVPGGKAVVTTKGASSTSVELEFTVGEDAYKVARKGASASVWKNGELVAKSAAAVNAFLEELLGMSMKRFLQLRYGEQKETEALLTMGAAELHKIIQEVSEIDIVERAITGCASIVNTAKAQLQVMPDEDADALLDQVNALALDMHAMYNHLQTEKAELDALTQQEEAARTALSEANSHNLSVMSTTERMRVLSDEMASLSLQLGEVKLPGFSAQECRENIAFCERAGSEFLDQKAQAEAQLQVQRQLEDEIKVLAERTTATRQLLSLAEADLTRHEMPGNLSAELTILTELKATQGSLSAQLEQATVARSGSVCPTCRRPYDDDPSHLAELDAEIERLTLQQAEAGRAVADQTAVVKRVEALTRSLQQVQQSVDRHTETLRHQQESLEQAKGQHSDLIKSDWGQLVATLARGLESSREEMEKWRARHYEAQAAETTLTGLRARQEKVAAELDALPKVGPLIQIEPLELTLNDAMASTKALSATYTARSADYAVAHKNYTVLQEEYRKAKDASDRRKQTETRLAVATALGKYLKRNRDRFVSNVWDGILGYASAFASDTTGGVITEVSRTEDGCFAYVESGAGHPIEAASGAQKSIMGLGVQLALGQMLPSALPIMLLDEPSSDMDAEHSLTLASLLSASADPNQLLMVSHRELDGAAAANTIDLGGI